MKFKGEIMLAAMIVLGCGSFVLYSFFSKTSSPTESAVMPGATPDPFSQVQSYAQPTPVNTATKISASKLIRVYANNEINGDDRFKGEILEVSGIIEQLSKDILGHPYIELGGEDYNGFNGIQCLLPDQWTDKIKDLNKGDSISITGMCTGYLAGQVIINCRQ